MIVINLLSFSLIHCVIAFWNDKSLVECGVIRLRKLFSKFWRVQWIIWNRNLIDPANACQSESICRVLIRIEMVGALTGFAFKSSYMLYNVHALIHSRIYLYTVYCVPSIIWPQKAHEHERDRWIAWICSGFFILNFFSPSFFHTYTNQSSLKLTYLLHI